MKDLLYLKDEQIKIVITSLCIQRNVSDPVNFKKFSWASPTELYI